MFSTNLGTGMKRISLADFVSQNGQERSAAVFGVRQSAVSKALACKRDITVIIHADGQIFAEEIRPFPSKKISVAQLNNVISIPLSNIQP